MRYGIYRKGALASDRIADLLTPSGAEPARLDDEFFAAVGVPAPGRTLFRGVEEEDPEIPAPERFVHHLHSRGPEYLDALQDRIQAAVPRLPAVSLSGGLDSAIVAIRGLPEVAISSSYAEYDESSYAALVADQIGAKHVVVRPTAEDCRRALPAIVEAVGQPIFPSSAVGCWMVAEKAAELGVPEIADGTGPDEMLGGYVRHLLVLLETRARSHPEIVEGYRGLIARAWGPRALDAPEDRYFDLLRAGPAGPSVRKFVSDTFARFSSDHLVSAMCAVDLALGMRGFLAMTAGCARAHGIRWSSPILCDPVAALALDMADDLKIRLSSTPSTKWALRRVAERIGVPQQIVNRTDKRGWVTPVAAWLDGPLREWSDELRGSLQARGIALRSDPSRGEFDQGPFQDICLELWLRRFCPDFAAR